LPTLDIVQKQYIIMILSNSRFTFSNLGGPRCTFAHPKHKIQGGQTQK